MNENSMAIEIDGVSKKYGKYTVLDNLSLHVGYGEIYGFLGLNGAGKSTTIKMLLAMIRPNAGSLRMMNEKVDAGNYQLWRNVGYLTVFMSSHLLEELSKLAARIGIIHEGHLIEEVKADKLEQDLKKCLLLDGKDRESIKRILADNGYASETNPQGYIRLTDSRSVQNPERLVELLVKAGKTPAMVTVNTEDLESYFLRKISGNREGSR